MQSTEAAKTTNVDGGAGNDHILISPQSGNLNSIVGKIVIDGGSNDAETRYLSTGGKVLTRAGLSWGRISVRNGAAFVETVDLFAVGDTVEIFDDRFAATGNTYDMSATGSEMSCDHDYGFRPTV